MTDYQKYINALRKCAKEHENDRTSTGHIIVSDLCRDTANLLEALDQEPTTKNDLGVDCISRQAAIDCLDYTDGELPITKIKNLPSAPPTRKGKWLRMSDLSEQEDDRYKCSRCGNVIHYKNKMDLYTFNSWCGRCGSDNGEHINYEVEE